jgi:hypothetical protein
MISISRVEVRKLHHAEGGAGSRKFVDAVLGLENRRMIVVRKDSRFFRAASRASSLREGFGRIVSPILSNEPVPQSGNEFIFFSTLIGSTFDTF